MKHEIWQNKSFEVIFKRFSFSKCWNNTILSIEFQLSPAHIYTHYISLCWDLHQRLNWVKSTSNCNYGNEKIKYIETTLKDHFAD